MGEEKKANGEIKRTFKPKSFLGKVWYFIWYDDSALSWIVNIILAYVLIKYLFYPLLGLIMGTSYPIVAVVSTSMVHNDSFDNWWTQNQDFYLARNITEEEFRKFPFRNGFNKGDLMVLVGKNPADIKLGDIIVFQSRKPYPIIHRVISKKDENGWIFQTKGDNNKAQIRDFELDETRVLQNTIYGKSVIRIPWLGYVKIWFVNALGLVGLTAS
jgi:hypothetical protein